MSNMNIKADMAGDGRSQRGPGQPKPLTAKQILLVAALLTGRSVSDAARELSVAERTARRWVALPDFQHALGVAKRESLDLAVRRLRALALEAVTVLASALKQADLPEGERSARVAGLVLGHVERLSELHEVEYRMAEVERRLGGQR